MFFVLLVHVPGIKFAMAASSYDLIGVGVTVDETAHRWQHMMRKRLKLIATAKQELMDYAFADSLYKLDVRSRTDYLITK